VNYRPASDFTVTCGGCGYYAAPYQGETGACTLVGGAIRPDYVCDAYAALDVPAAIAEAQQVVMMEHTFDVVKADEARQIVFGWAYVAEDAQGQRVLDHSGEFVTKEDLEDTAYVFNMAFREGDERHTETVAAHLIESFVVTDEKLEQMGLAKDALPRGWWTGWYVPDRAVWDKVASGEYQMLSIGGVSEREAVDA